MPHLQLGSLAEITAERLYEQLDLFVAEDDETLKLPKQPVPPVQHKAAFPGASWTCLSCGGLSTDDCVCEHCDKIAWHTRLPMENTRIEKETVVGIDSVTRVVRKDWEVPFEYVGIKVDGDHRFTLASGVITHNCGHGVSGNSAVPRMVLDTRNIRQVAAGRYHSFALTDCGILYSWGCGGQWHRPAASRALRR